MKELCFKEYKNKNIIKIKIFQNEYKKNYSSKTQTNISNFESFLLNNKEISKKKVMFIGGIWPEKSSSAAGVRTFSLIEIAQNALQIYKKNNSIFSNSSNISFNNENNENITENNDKIHEKYDKNDKFQVLFAATAKKDSIYRKILEESFPGLITAPIQVNDPSFDDLLRDFNPDICFFGFPFFLSFFLIIILIII